MMTYVLTQDQVVNLLLWAVVSVGAALVALVAWQARRLQTQADRMPEVVMTQTKELHKELLRDLSEMKVSLTNLERELRAHLLDLDRRITRLEVRSNMD